MRMINRKNFLLSVFAFSASSMLVVHASELKFSNFSSQIALDPGGTFKVVRPAKITGFSEMSIIKNTSQAMNLWVGNYNPGDTITYSTAPTHLINTTSHAVAHLDGVMRTNSHALVYGDRISSNAIKYLETTNNAAHTTMNATMRVNSHALVALKTSNDSAHTTFTVTARVTSHALVYGDRISSNAIKYLETTNNAAHTTMNATMRVNSHALVALKTSNDAAHTTFTNNIRYNSNALEYRFRTNSNTINALVGIENTTMNIATDTTINNIRLIKNGFSIASGKTLTINTPLRVSGNMAFADATAALTLNGDLTLASDAQFISPAKINGSGKTMCLSGAFNAGNDITIAGGLLIDGNGNDVYFDNTNQLILESATTVTLQNMNLHLVGNSPIAITGASQITLRNVTIKLENNVTFASGYFHVNEGVIVSGEGYVLTYSSTNPLTIHDNSLLSFDIGTEFIFNPGGSIPHTVDQRSGLRFENRTAVLACNSATFTVPTAGIAIANGTVVFENNVTLNNKDASNNYNTNPAYAITIDSTNSNIYVLAGARVDVNGYVDILGS